MTPEVISVVAGLVSIALGILVIVLSLWFFRQTKDSERNVSNGLTKIETQADMLSKLTGRQLDRLTKFVTEPKPVKSDEQMGELIRIFAQLPKCYQAQPRTAPDLTVSSRSLCLLHYIFILPKSTGGHKTHCLT